LAVAKKLGGSRDLYLITTHVHAEHDLGAQAFPASTKLIRSKDQERDIAEFGLRQAHVFAARNPVNADLLKGAEYRKADISFFSDYELDLGGGVRAQIVAMGPNHTRGDTAIWIEADRVLFSGDVAMKAQPAFSSPYGNIRQWLASVNLLESFKPSLVVPSHGPIGEGTAFMTGYRDYLTEVRDRTAAEKRAGRSLAQATDTVTEALIGRYPDRGRLAGAIKVAYAEAN
jgi:glyoxylase-like metal-dependent hydrolase (beta-lactamase superfamily II)